MRLPETTLSHQKRHCGDFLGISNKHSTKVLNLNLSIIRANLVHTKGAGVSSIEVVEINFSRDRSE